MRKKFLLFFLILSVGMIFPYSVMIFKVKDKIPDSIFEHFGTRSANVQVLNLSSKDSRNFILLIKGWIFIGQGIGIKDKMKDNMVITLKGVSLNVDVTLKKKGIYLILDPHLLIVPKDVERIKILGINIDIKDLLQSTTPP